MKSMLWGVRRARKVAESGRNMICVALVAAVCSFAPEVGCQKVPDIKLSTRFGDDPSVAAVSSTVYVAWVSLGRDVYFNRSLDRGATWLPSEMRIDTDVFGSGSTSEVRVAAAGSAVFVAWVDDRNSGLGDIYYNYSPDRGTTWLASDVRLETEPPGTSWSSDLQVVADSSCIYIIWRDVRSGTASVYFNRSLDLGATWLPGEVKIDTIQSPAQPQASAWPQLAASGSSVYVVWYDGYFGKGDIYFNRSVDGGASWLPSATRLDSDPPWAEDSRYPQIDVVGSAVYVVWQDSRDGGSDVYFNRSMDRGTTWLPSELRLDTDSPGAASSIKPKIAAHDANVYVAWHDKRDGSNAVYANISQDAGGTWLASDIRIDDGLPTSAQSNSPEIAAGESSVFVLWTHVQAASGLRDVHFNRSMDRGATWLSGAVTLSTRSPGAGALAIQVVASDSTVFATWVGNNSFPPSVYFNIPFGMQPYGAGLAGSGGLVPQFAGDGFATIGGAVSLNVSDALGAATGAVIAGPSRSADPILGGVVLVAPIVAVPVVLGGGSGVAGAGELSLPLFIPNDEVFIGMPAFLQLLTLDPGAPAGVSMSNGIELWIG